jgi:predicted Zn-dependent protease
MIDRLQALADQGDVLAGEVTLPLVQGIHAFAQGAYGKAVRLMEPLFNAPRLDQLARIGGSHAQREVFEDTMLEAYLRAAQFDKAEEMLRTRLQRRASARDLFWLGRAQMSTGRPEAARASLQEVTQRWQNADLESSEYTTLNRLAAQAS